MGQAKSKDSLYQLGGNLNVNECKSMFIRNGIKLDNEKEIMSSFRKWSLQNHPDKGGSHAVFVNMSDCINSIKDGTFNIDDFPDDSSLDESTDPSMDTESTETDKNYSKQEKNDIIQEKNDIIDRLRSTLSMTVYIDTLNTEIRSKGLLNAWSWYSQRGNIFSPYLSKYGRNGENPAIYKYLIDMLTYIYECFYVHKDQQNGLKGIQTLIDFCSEIRSQDISRLKQIIPYDQWSHFPMVI